MGSRPKLFFFSVLLSFAFGSGSSAFAESKIDSVSTLVKNSVCREKLETQFVDASEPSSALSVSQLFKKITSTADRLTKSKEFLLPRAWRMETATYGLPGLDLPKDLGGKDFSATKMAKLFEFAGTKSLDLRDVIGAGHARPLMNSTSPVIRAVAEKVARGEGYVAIAITEPDAGSNMRAMKSTAEKVEGGYLLSGEKLYNARFTTATDVIIFTQAPGQNGTSGKLNAFVLPIDYAGLKYIELGAHGLEGNSFGGVSFKNLFVPERYRIGEDGGGGKVFKNHFMYWRLMMASAAIGTGKGALAQAVSRMRSRDAFGAPIGRFTHLQQALAEHTAKLHMASLLVEQAAKKLDQGKFDEAAPLVAMAKCEGVEFAIGAADFSMKVFGAAGYSDQFDLGRRMRDLMGLRIADGTTDIMRMEVVRKIYGEDFWDMAMGVGAQ